MKNPMSVTKKNSKTSKKFIAVLLALGLIAGGVYEYKECFKKYPILDDTPSSSYGDANVDTTDDLVDDTDNLELEIDNQIKKDEINSCVDVTVENLCQLYDELGLDSPIEVLTVYNEVLNSGYLSKNNSFSMSDSELNDIVYDYNVGYSVLEGKGVCRNVDDLFRKSLNGYGFSSYSTTCYNSTSKPDNNASKEANHQLTIVNYDDQIYLLDVTQNTILDNYKYDKLYTDENNYNYLMPECSLEENGYLCSYNSQANIDEINTWVDIDESSLQQDYIDKEIKEANEKYNNKDGRAAVKTFKNNMKDYVFSNMV